MDVAAIVIVNVVVALGLVGGIALQVWARKRGARLAAESNVDRPNVLRTRIIGLVLVLVVGAALFALLQQR